MKWYNAVYWLLVVAGVALAFVAQMPLYAVIALVAAVGFSLFEAKKPEGLQMFTIVLTILCVMGALSGFQPSWLPWTGVGIFGFLTLTAKL